MLNRKHRWKQRKHIGRGNNVFELKWIYEIMVYNTAIVNVCTYTVTSIENRFKEETVMISLTNKP